MLNFLIDAAVIQPVRAILKGMLKNFTKKTIWRIQLGCFGLALILVALVSYQTPYTIPGPSFSVVVMGILFAAFCLSSWFFDRIAGKLAVILVGTIILFNAIVAVTRQPPCGGGQAIGLIAITPCQNLNIPLLRLEGIMAMALIIVGLSMTIALGKRRRK